MVLFRLITLRFDELNLALRQCLVLIERALEFAQFALDFLQRCFCFLMLSVVEITLFSNTFSSLSKLVFHALKLLSVSTLELFDLDGFVLEFFMHDCAFFLKSCLVLLESLLLLFEDLTLLIVFNCLLLLLIS